MFNKRYGDTTQCSQYNWKIWYSNYKCFWGIFSVYKSNGIDGFLSYQNVPLHLYTMGAFFSNTTQIQTI